MIRVLVIVGCWSLVSSPAVLAANESGEHPGAGLAPWLVTAVLVAALVLFGAWRLTRRAATDEPGAREFAHSGHSQFDPAIPRQYSPLNVGNDASARPWEQQGSVELPAADEQTVLPAAYGARVPEGFDAEAFLRDSKANFIGLQAAWDQADIPTLRAMMTEGMLSEIQLQLTERERAGQHADGRSEVIVIDAQLLGIEELTDRYTASVEFSGLMREGSGAGPNPFRELWNITRLKADGGRWQVAGVQALQ
ncbi:MAG: Tim44 domain-containing protein [Burkholderiales bacterium]|nr:MAG: Tim44 domain-containing protein [Burkholderiales bacterium]